jgi:hypothetical protein
MVAAHLDPEAATRQLDRAWASYGSSLLVALGWYGGLARCPMKRVGLGVLLLAWLYGVPFLLIVGLIRRTSSPFMATHAAALAFGATTDTILTAALVFNLTLPVAGVLLAWLIRDQYWTRHYVWSLAGMVLIYLAVMLAGLSARRR